ncbi:unnamed protein product [Adineta ricciae]|uniref:Uncharacterized protein n=1 Tax=Adineta ricciae TaxID=249248 RepID=A0A815A6Z8_ADIRI|nr:unnamed protein product [Adineta ricciae]
MKTNKNTESINNAIWQRNLSNARNIRINLESIMDGPMKLLYEILDYYENLTGTDPIGLLLSLFVCVGHLCAESTVKITNHISKLNLFLLLIGPSGSGKSKIISPIKKAIINVMKALGVSKDDAGIMDDFTNASLSAKLSKTNVFILTDEAEKPLLSLGFYSPLSEVSAADRIAGCKFFGTIPTSKDTMSYHLEINSHLSFVGATTGRLWHRLIHFYAQGYQSDGFSERFLHYVMPKKNEIHFNSSQTIEYDELDDDNANGNDQNDDDDDISDDDYQTEQKETSNQNLPSLCQILIVVRLFEKRKFVLSRNGTKKFYNKVRQYQELSQMEKPDDVNYGSRMGKSAEILRKLVAICQILKISMDVLKTLQDENQLISGDLSFNFIRNVTQIIETKYKSANAIIQIDSSSCRLAGTLLCSHLLKTLFALYNTDPLITSEEQSTRSQSISIHTNMNTIRERIFRFPQLFFLKSDLTGNMGLLRHYPSEMVNTVLKELVSYELLRQGPFVMTTSRGIVHMKSYPSNTVLHDPSKVVVVERILNDLNLDLPSYMSILCTCVIKEKQVLTLAAKELLISPEHTFLFHYLNERYPERRFNDIEKEQRTSDSTNIINETLSRSSVNNSSCNDESFHDSSIFSISSHSLISLNTTSSHNQTNTSTFLPITTSTNLIRDVSQNLSDNNTDSTGSIITNKQKDNNILSLTEHPSTVSNVQTIDNKTNFDSSFTGTSNSFQPTLNRFNQQTNDEYINPVTSVLSMNILNESIDASTTQTSISTITNILPSSSTIVHVSQQNECATISTQNSENLSINEKFSGKNDVDTTKSIQTNDLSDDDSNMNKLIDQCHSLSTSSTNSTVTKPKKRTIKRTKRSTNPNGQNNTKRKSSTKRMKKSE